MKRFLYLFYFGSLITPAVVFSQGSYIATDSSKQVGLKLIDGTLRDNCKFIKVKTKGEAIITTYFPGDLDEYGFKDGTVYKSRNITINGENRLVFLKKLVKDSVSLYYYSSKDHQAFYLETEDSTLIELRRNRDRNYKAILTENLADCSSSKNDIRLVRYKKDLLSRLVSNYNTCSSRPFPYTKFGVIVGYGLTGLSLPSNYSGELDANTALGSYKVALAGLSFDTPIQASYFSVHVDLLISKNGYSYYHRSNGIETDILINHTALDVPLQIRYTFPSMKLRPFVNAGSIFSYHLKNSSGIYKSIAGQHETVINEVFENTLISDLGVGFAAGAGLQFNVNFKNTISIELRFTKRYSNSDFLNIQQIGFLTEFTF